jgi:hypothetical protein
VILKKEYRVSVSVKRVLRKMFAPNPDEIIWGRRKLHNEELHKLYSPLYIIGMIKSKRLKWGVHVAGLGEK